jgi:hypothetical protein
MLPAAEVFCYFPRGASPVDALRAGFSLGDTDGRRLNVHVIWASPLEYSAPAAIQFSPNCALISLNDLCTHRSVLRFYAFHIVGKVVKKGKPMEKVEADRPPAARAMAANRRPPRAGEEAAK